MPSCNKHVVEEARAESSRLFQALLSALEDKKKKTEEGKDEREPRVGKGNGVLDALLRSRASEPQPEKKNIQADSQAWSKHRDPRQKCVGVSEGQMRDGATGRTGSKGAGR